MNQNAKKEAQVCTSNEPNYYMGYHSVFQELGFDCQSISSWHDVCLKPTDIIFEHPYGQANEMIGIHLVTNGATCPENVFNNAWFNHWTPQEPELIESTTIYKGKTIYDNGNLFYFCSEQNEYGQNMIIYDSQIHSLDFFHTFYDNYYLNFYTCSDDDTTDNDTTTTDKEWYENPIIWIAVAIIVILFMFMGRR